MESQKSLTQRNCPLPDDLILHEIVPRLPTKSVIRFKYVSKTWLSRISQNSSLIATKHTAGEETVTIIVAFYTAEKERIDRIFFLGHRESNLVEIDTSYLWKKNPYPTGSCFELIGSCNGLVCLQLWYSDEIWDLVLWNPATREVNYLPAAAVTPGYDERYATYVFGFDTQTGDHKVVRLEEVETDDEELVKINVQILSRKSGHWRELKSLSKTSDTIISLEEWLTVDGAIYWIVDTYNPFQFDTFTIMSFDVSKEEFRELEGPPLDGDMNFDDLVLVKWKGSLGAIWVKPEGTGSQFWLKNDSNIGWEISTMDPSLRPLTIPRRFRDPMLLRDRFPVSNAENEILYNLLTFHGREVAGPLGNLYYYGICHHSHTLISPN